MKKFSVKTIVAIGIGAALFFVLGRFVSIPSPVPNTTINVQYGLLAFMSVIYGPLAGALMGLIGHALIDFSFGWAATPAGLTAMEQLEALEEERRRKKDPLAQKKGIANSEMCTFLVINISSLQLIPINMIAYRAEYGSADPLAVVGPALLATTLSTLAGILFCKLMK